jgi:hypothetical protein
VLQQCRVVVQLVASRYKGSRSSYPARLEWKTVREGRYQHAVLARSRDAKRSRSVETKKTLHCKENRVGGAEERLRRPQQETCEEARRVQCSSARRLGPKQSDLLGVSLSQTLVQNARTDL